MRWRSNGNGGGEWYFRPTTVSDFNGCGGSTNHADPIIVAKYAAEMAAKGYFSDITTNGRRDKPTEQKHLEAARKIYITTLKRSGVVGVPDIDEMRLLAEYEMRRRYCAGAKTAAEAAAMLVFERATSHDEGRALRGEAREAAVDAAIDFFKRFVDAPDPKAGAENVVRGISFDTLAHKAGKLITGDTIRPVSSVTRSGEGPRASA